jgi:hypothetical protein
MVTKSQAGGLVLLKQNYKFGNQPHQPYKESFFDYPSQPSAPERKIKVDATLYER